MIAAFDVIDGGHAGRIAALFPPKIRAQLRIYDGVPITCVTQCRHRRGVDWKRVKRMSDAGVWLVPKGTVCDESTGVVPFVPKHLPFRLLERFAVSAIKKADIRASKLCVGVRSDSFEILDGLVEQAKEIRVLTQDDFEEKSEELLSRYGAAVIAGQDERLFLGCHAVIAPKGLNGCPTDRKAIVFASGRRDNAANIQNVRIKAEEGFAPLAQKYGDMLVVSALYESGTRPEYGNILPQEAFREGCVISVGEAADSVRRAVQEV